MDLRRKVVLLAELDPIAAKGLDRLADRGIELVRRQDLADGPEDDVAEAIEGAWGVIAGNGRLGIRALLQATALRVIAKPGTGHDNIDVAAATDRSVGVFTTPGANQDAVADMTLGLMLAVIRRIARSDRQIRSGGWRSGEANPGLHGRVVGVVGLGAIGRAVTKRLMGFDCTILAADPNPPIEFCRANSIELLNIDELVRASEVITLHVPLSADTHHLFDRDRIAAMRPGSILVNTSRGSIVDQAALEVALSSGALAGAGLDVFEVEPLPPDSALIRLESTVLTAHIAAHTSDAMRSMVDAVVDGLVAVAEGQVPTGCLNPSVFEGQSVASPPSASRERQRTVTGIDLN